jgi:hypothetical protein
VIVALYDCNRIILRHLGPRVNFANNFQILRGFGLPKNEEELSELAEICR